MTRTRMNFVHLHASRDEGGKGCRTVCGLPCGSRETTAYRGLDPHRVTCPACKATAPATDDLPPNTCPYCRGKGTLPGQNFVAQSSVAPNCWHCNGQGVVVPPTQPEWAK